MQNTEIKNTQDLDAVSISWSSRIESISKIVIALIGICYAIGILIINLYYYKYGYYSLSLFRLNYAISGFYSLAYLFASYFVWEMFFENIFTVFRSKSDKIERLVSAIGIIIGPLTIWTVISLITVWIGFKGSWEWAWLSFLGYISLLSTADEIVLLVKSRMKNKIRIGKSFEVIFSLMFLFVYFAGFSKLLFPSIPANIGGGMLHEVQFVVAANQVNSLESLGIEFQKPTSDTVNIYTPSKAYFVSNQIKVLTITSDDFVVIKSDSLNESIVLNRQSILAIKNIKSNHR